MAQNFSEEERYIILPTLAVCAKDCYFFERKHNLTKYVTELEEHRVMEHSGTESKVQYAVYEMISPPEYAGRRILAIRGTKTVRTIIQDVNLIDTGQIIHKFIPSVFGKMSEEGGWDMIREIIDIAQEAADRLKPDYITGHSLGGLMAEVVSSYSRIPGVSFNCPGPVGFVTETTFLNPDTSVYKGVPFEIHLRENDPVSQINYELHINDKPFWHPGTSHHMDDMAKSIQKDMPLIISENALSVVSGPFSAVNRRAGSSNKRKKRECKILKRLFRE